MLRIEIEEFFNQHKASSRLYNQFAIHDLNRDLLRSEKVLTITRPGSRHEEFARIERVCHQDVNLVCDYWLVDYPFCFDISVELTLLLFFVSHLNGVSILKIRLQSLYNGVLAFDHLIELVLLCNESVQIVFFSSKLLFVDFKLLVELSVFALDLLDLVLDLLAHLLLLQNVAFGQVDRNLYPLNVLPHRSGLLVLAVRLAHLGDKRLNACNSRVHHLFKLPNQFLERDLGLCNELFVCWYSKVALDMILLFRKFGNLFIAASDIFQKFFNELAQQLFISSAMNCCNLA